jgi:hypothetical protein
MPSQKQNISIGNATRILNEQPIHEASSSWLKLCWFILGHPVDLLIVQILVLNLFNLI